MENLSFEGDSATGNPPADPMDNPPGPSEAKLQEDPPDTTRSQPKEAKPIDAMAFADEDDHESPPAYVQRHMPQEVKIDDLEDLEQPATEPIQEPRDCRLDPEFQQQARNRRERRLRQNLVEGPLSLRPDSPNLPPLPEPEPYPDLQPAPAADPAAPADPTPPAAPATWPVRFQEMYRRICIFSFQFPFHTLLLSWPLATAAMGVMNLHACPIDFFLPYVMLAVGIFGTVTIVLRLYTIYFEKMYTTRNTSNYWLVVRTAEAIIWVFFVVQLIYFFKQAPSFTPGERHYCKWKYYKINCVLMSLSSLTMLGWIVVNVTKAIQWIRSRNVPPST